MEYLLYQLVSRISSINSMLHKGVVGGVIWVSIPFLFLIWTSAFEMFMKTLEEMCVGEWHYPPVHGMKTNPTFGKEKSSVQVGILGTVPSEDL